MYSAINVWTHSQGARHGHGEIIPPVAAVEEPPPVAIQEPPAAMAEVAPRTAIEHPPGAGGLDQTTTAAVEDAAPVVTMSGKEEPAACDYDICSRTYRVPAFGLHLSAIRRIAQNLPARQNAYAPTGIVSNGRRVSDGGRGNGAGNT
jgi:hypothetical protein